MADSANAVPATKAWISDIHGASEMSELADANLHLRAEVAKHWKSLRRKLIIQLQLTFNIFDSLVDYTNASSGNTVFDESHQVVLKSYKNLGEKTGGARQPNLRQADVRQRL